VKAFGRRPRCKPNRPDGPSSETLHNGGHEGSAGSCRYGQHQGRGNVGQLVAPQTKRTANPSPINVAPTSTPLTQSVRSGGQSCRHWCPQSPPDRNRQPAGIRDDRCGPVREGAVRRLRFLRSASQRARPPVSGALNLTKRTFGRPSPRPMVSPSMTYTDTEAGAGMAAAGVGTVRSPERFDETLTAAKLPR
jgi:hypothetical protein